MIPCINILNVSLTRNINLIKSHDSSCNLKFESYQYFIFYIFINIQILILITNKKNYIMKKLGKKREFEKMTVNAYTYCNCSSPMCMSSCENYADNYCQSTDCSAQCGGDYAIINNSSSSVKSQARFSIANQIVGGPTGGVGMSINQALN